MQIESINVLKAKVVTKRLLLRPMAFSFIDGLWHGYPHFDVHVSTQFPAAESLSGLSSRGESEEAE
jgi:hypothetical protein